jgi:hypothetical protein
MRHVPAIHRPAGTRSRRLRRLAVTLACLSVAGVSLSPTSARAEDCPNAPLRAENNSTRLPECRAYEMVTPLYKEGFPVDARGLGSGYTDDGIVAYASFGNFAGNELGGHNNYHATRSPAGWTNAAQGPSHLIYDTGTYNAVEPESADLSRQLWVMRRRDVPGEPFGYWLGTSNGSFTRIGDFTQASGAPWFIKGYSSDLSHVLLNEGTESAMHEYVGTGNEGPPRLVTVDNNGQLQGGCINSVSADGRVIGYGCGGALWARVGGSATVEVSGSDCTRASGDPGGPCNASASASFAGAATDGSRVYFTTAQQLVNGDTDQSNDLYECAIPPGSPAPVGTANPCASLTEVSDVESGANVESVVKVSEDGSRVYFIAQGVLAANLGTNDAAAVTGDNNLYVSEKDAGHPAGQITFVTKLQSNDISGAASTVDGRYLIFNTASQLLASDTDEAIDIYRYDAETHGLLRVSTDTDGGGNAPGGQAIIPFPAEHRPHSAMTDDGSVVVFETNEALSPADTDGMTDVYEWHDGQLSEISNGGGSRPVITSSGQDIFFETAQPLTVGDSGSEDDIYDARVGGGFPVRSATPCSGEACQGAAAAQPQPLVPGASGSAALSGLSSPLAIETPPAHPRPKPLTQAQKLTKALKACKAKHNKRKRSACERRARKTYRRAK